MSILNGDAGIKILEGFNIFLKNQRNPINPNDAHGFVDLEIQKLVNGELTQANVIRTLFNVETTIPAEVFQIIDESKMANVIATKIQTVTSLTYFGLMKVKVKNIGIATGYDNAFNIYEIG